MEDATIQEQPNLEQPYAGFPKRFAAYLLDCLILSIVFIPLTIMFLDNSGMLKLIQLSEKLPKGSTDLIAFVYPNYVILVQNAIRESLYFSLILFAFTILYFALWESSRKQATPGKLALKIRVSDAKGTRTSFTRALGRNFCKLFSSAILMLGYLMPLWTKHKQALHDQMTNCLVLKK